MGSAFAGAAASAEDASTVWFNPAGMAERTRIGLGVNAPFSLETNYAGDWSGCHHALKSAMQTINLK